MKILVTGASGFIGRNFVRLCLENGHHVRALYRRANLDQELQEIAATHAPRLEFLRADLSFPNSMPDLDKPEYKNWLKSARTGIPAEAPEWDVHPEDASKICELASGCDALVHVAALALDWGPFETFFAANVNPLQVMARAVLDLPSPPDLVLVSSMAVHGFGNHTRSLESGPYYEASNPYQTSKRMAESLAAGYARKGLRIAVIRPGNVYGPGDTTTFYPIFEAMEKGIMGTLGGGKYLTCPIHIDDLCKALYSCTLRLQSGQLPDNMIFDIAHTGQATWKEVMDIACEGLGKAPRYPNLPGALAWTAAALLEGTFRLFRIRTAPPLTFYRISQLLNNYDFEPRTAMEHLGWKPEKPLDEGMKHCARSWKVLQEASRTR